MRLFDLLSSAKTRLRLFTKDGLVDEGSLAAVKVEDAG